MARLQVGYLDQHTRSAIAGVFRQHDPGVGLGEWLDTKRLLLVQQAGMQPSVRRVMQARAQEVAQAGLGLLGRIEHGMKRGLIALPGPGTQHRCNEKAKPRGDRHRGAG